ncbi:MAG: hypothetical protein JXR03_20600 [Cyclobacteriaceae bacterium]
MKEDIRQSTLGGYFFFSVERQPVFNHNVLVRDNLFSAFFDVRNGTTSGHKLVVFGKPIQTATYNFRF